MSVCYPVSSDVCLNIFATVWPQHFDFPHGAHVLEVGCAEADWIGPMKAVRPDLHITGIDWRGCDRKAADQLIRGDVMQQRFESLSFDAVVFISSLEHIGLGHYDADPPAIDGDVFTMARVTEWLKPGGVVYFDVPWQPDRYEVCGTSHRTYDDAALEQRLASSGWWRDRFRGWTLPLDTTHLIPRPTQRSEPFYYCACVWEKA